jgi:hypothetical protein
VVRDEGRFNSQLPDYSWITDNSEGIHLDEKRPYRRCAGGHDPEVVMNEAVVQVKAD